MRSFLLVLLCVSGSGLALRGEDAAVRAWQMERNGDAAGAEAMLQKAATGEDADGYRAYAQFLDRHGDPNARDAYRKLLAIEVGPAKAPTARRLFLLDLIAGDRDAAAKDLAAYQSAGGTGLTLPAEHAAEAKSTVPVPGPLRSFARMAALAPEISSEDFFQALARNIITNGYQATNSNEALEQTEYLKLVIRYLAQARELEQLAGPTKVLRIETCDSAKTGDLLRILGYRMRGACGGELVLETLNASRAFLTIDSGFPLAMLEQSLRTNRPFEYDYHPTNVAVLYGPAYWQSAREGQGGDFLDFLIGDPSLCRLYLGMSKLEPETAAEIKRAVPVGRLRAYAHVIDFYGSMFEIRDGKAVVPGGARSEKAWGELAGVGPEHGAQFFERLLAKDDGWLASYYDALARLEGPVQNYLTDPDRMRRYYAAIRGKVTSPGPARPVFRANTDMLLLTSRLRLDADGKPHIPGSIEVWRDLFVQHPHGKYDAKLTKSASAWKSGDDVIEALFGLTRKSVENEPLKIFLSLSDIDRRRTTPLDSATANRLAREYSDFGAQYSLFSEAPEIGNATINRYLDAAGSVNGIRDLGHRSDAAGTLQALTGLWQIFYRQGSIAPAEADASLSNLLQGFADVKSERDVFEAGRAGVKILLAATHSPADASPQDRFIDLLAGTSQATNSDAQTQIVENMIRIFESQRLISLTDIFSLTDQLERVAKGEKVNSALIAKTAARIGEIQLPRASLSNIEKSSLAFGYWPEKHIEAQRKLNLRALIDRAATDPKKLDDVRGLLAPFLRDTLVGLNYVHYAPPGAQILQTNPLFVRSHDFVGLSSAAQTWRSTEVMGSGWPTSAGGKLTGSLAGLPYALAQAEQNFLVPSREQALIWGDLVPQMLVSAVIPRYWNVTPGQLHWVGLHMRFAETALAEAAADRTERDAVLAALNRHAPPVRVRKVASLLANGDVRGAIENVTPSEMFAVSRDLLAKQRQDSDPLGREIQQEAAGSPGDLNYAAISHAFGTPKPTLTNSYSTELLNLRTFPTLMGYSSRIMAESWESNLLFYAAMADELHVPPAQLNVLIPEWTQQTVEHIFATHLEDWPALLRSLRSVGEDARHKSRKATAANAGGM